MHPRRSPDDPPAPAGGVQTDDVACALCGERDARLLFEQEDRRFPQTPRTRFALVECRRCGLRYLNPRPASLDRFYPSEYYSVRRVRREDVLRRPSGPLRRLRPPRRLRQLREKLRDVRRATPPGGSVLEYGPGGGDLLV
ncbi:MAG: hypothetical protein GF355_08630, partial [Candidatus Eisenbacteria bacterium]|nr:hypothetical protein [Candidatus Eisenbacteria bacterium]